jgi:hypothetical protein
MADVKYLEGMFIKRHQKAPEFVICSLSFKVEEFIKFLQDNQKDGWVNCQIKLSKKGSYYAQIDDYAGKAKNATESQVDTETTNVSGNGSNEPNNAESSELKGSNEGIEYPNEEINQDVPF